MAEYIHTVPWAPHGPGSVTPSRLRSLTPTPMKKEVTRSISTPQLKQTMQAESDGMNTIPDPRNNTPKQPSSLSRANSADSSNHPDLSQEVATLSTKLINAINHQTSLDDSLQQTRHELDTAKERLAELEAQVKEHEQKVAAGLLVDKEVYDKMEKQLSGELEEERRRRTEAEKSKRKTDGEVEALTAALFEEANVMVAAARKETEASDKRNEQLKQQLGDADVLQQSLQEQLQDLKGVMERMSSQSDDNESNTLATTTAPSTPGITPADKMSKLFEATANTPNTPGSDEVTPDHPLHFSHLIHPILRSDLNAFKEFQEMLKISARSSAPNSRVSSGNYGSLNVLGLASMSLASSSTTSLPSTKTANGNSSPRDAVAGAGMPNLKDEKFFKRALAEDIEPTLRLDIAPGLSWMARRTVINSITVGSLVVEPSPPPPKFRGPVFPCSLCGEARKGDQYARKFRFKPSDTEESPRYPLCDWCLGRVRATCDYIGFLRMVAAGHWRAETEEEKKSAWEESVRLRERMFWTRIGGGVVPSFVPMRESPRSPTFANSVKVNEARKSEDSQVSDKAALDSAVDMTEVPKEMQKSEEDPFKTKDADKEKRVSIGNTVISNDAAPKEVLTQEEEKTIEEQAEAQIHNEVPKSLEIRIEKPEQQQPPQQHQRSVSTPVTPELPPRKKDERLSLTIPGSFD